MMVMMMYFACVIAFNMNGEEEKKSVFFSVKVKYLPITFNATTIGTSAVAAVKTTMLLPLPNTQHKYTYTRTYVFVYMFR